MEKFDRFLNCLNKVVLGAIIIIGTTMLFVSWAHVFYRYVLNNSLSWSEELLKILLVCFCLLSATIIAIRREHVSIVIFKKKFPKKVEHYIDLVVQFIMFASSIVICILGVRMMINAGVRRTPALKVPYALTYLSVSVSFGIMALYELRNFLADLLKPGLPPADNEKMEEDF